MAALPSSTVSSTIPTPITSIGDFMARFNAFVADPGNANNPAVGLIKCLPTDKYSPTDIAILKGSLDTIQQESILFESARVYNLATEYINLFDTLTCTGEDAEILFNGFYDEVQRFIEFYNNLDTQVLKTDVNQNPNYYNN